MSDIRRSSNLIDLRSIEGYSESEILIQNKISTDIHEGNYKPIINNYFDDLYNLRVKYDNITTSRKYNSVQKIIKQLWRHSQKNPSIFETVKEFEPILQRQRKYRDHFIHSLNVYLLGYYILNKLVQHNESIFQRSNSPNLTWMLTATFHDVAYPIQNIDSWLNDIFSSFFGVNPFMTINMDMITAPIHIDLMKMISREHKQPRQGLLESGRLTATDWTYFSLLNERLNKKDHGILAALMLAHQLWVREKFSETDSGVYGDFLSNHIPACHAISTHTIPSIEIKFDKHPFAFLLNLCDNLQEWGRPTQEIETCRFELINIDVLNEERPIITCTIRPKQNIVLSKIFKELGNRLLPTDLLNIKILVENSSEIFFI